MLIRYHQGWYIGYNVADANKLQKYLKNLHTFEIPYQGWYNGYNVADALPRKRQRERLAGSQVLVSFLLVVSIIRVFQVPFASPFRCLSFIPCPFHISFVQHLILFTRLKRSIINPIGDFPEFLKKCDTLPRFFRGTKMFLWHRKYFL